MKDTERGKRLDFSIADVNAVYTGPVGVLWEMLMGEEIHVGGERETDILALRAGVGKNTEMLDVCSALGGPARHLARMYGCSVVGLDATQKMVDEAIRRTERLGLIQQVSFRLGNALDMPFRNATFDVVWGQDAWCYVTDKERLIRESFRVLRPGGRIAFTDWIQTGTMDDAEWTALNSFMVFPYMETFPGYLQLLERTGFEQVVAEDLSADFSDQCRRYLDILRSELKDRICSQYGAEMFSLAEEGLKQWVRAAERGKVGRGRWVATKPPELSTEKLPRPAAREC